MRVGADAGYGPFDARLGAIFGAWSNAAGVALATADESGALTFVNRYCAELCDPNATTLIDLVAPAGRAKAERQIRGVDVGSVADFSAPVGDGHRVARFLVTRADPDAAVSGVSVVAVFRDVTDESRREAQARHVASHDDLTGVLSRAAIIKRLRVQLASQETTGPVAVLFVDIDDFKATNDGFGHPVGDAVLKVVASRLEGAISGSDAVGRMGGDEFLVVMANAMSDASLLALGERLVRVLSIPIGIGGRTITPRLSVGVAIGRESTTTVDTMLVEADLALYTAKRSAASVAFADLATTEWSDQRLSIEQGLGAALDSDDIGVAYQPVVRLVDATVAGYEALLRWNHPKRGLLRPELIMDRAEAIGRLDDLTRWMLPRVVETWTALEPKLSRRRPRGVHVNLNSGQLSWPGYADFHMASLERLGVATDEVVVEVVESSQIGLGDAAEETLVRLGEYGVPIALDDFGVGFNALSYFLRFPVSILKIDRLLVSALPNNEAARNVVAGVVAIADGQGARVIGEGIENELEARVCEDLGMFGGQGWHFGRELRLEQLLS